MSMGMNQMMMARHHAEMYILDMQAAQAFQSLSSISMAKAQSNYQMYLNMSGTGGMAQPQPQPLPGMTQGMAPGMGSYPMTPGMMGSSFGSGSFGGSTGGSGGRDY